MTTIALGQVVATPVPRPPRPLRRGRGALISVVLTALAAVWALRLWRADWSVPFFWGGDAISSAGHFKTTLTTGWYESQPDLGFPYGQHYHDFPFTDDLQPAVIKVFGLFTTHWEVVFNLYYVLGFPAAALTSLYFFRRCRLPDALAISLSVLYALTPYHFARNEAHFFLGEYWMVPVAATTVMAVAGGRPVWGLRRSWRGRPLTAWCRPRGIRRAVAVATGPGAATAVGLVLTMYSGAYYGAFTVFLLAGAALAALVRTRRWRRFAGAAAAIGVLGAAFLASSLPDLLYERSNGPNTAGYQRADGLIERYALKPLQLLLPVEKDPVPGFGTPRIAYDKFPLTGEDPSVGVVAALGLLVLAAVLVLALLDRWGRVPDWAALRRARVMYDLAVVTAVGFLLAVTGGLSSVVGLVTSSIRGWNRLSIFLVLFALAGLGLAVSAGLDRWSRQAGTPPPPTVSRQRVLVSAAVMLVLGVFDESSANAVPQYAAYVREFTAEQRFVDLLQSELPAGAPLFQLPYVPWPESAPVRLSGDNDQLRLFLHSTTLRWSGGGIKGRPQTDWLRSVAAERPEALVHDLAVIGFLGIVVDQYGYSDSGRSLEAGLLAVLPGVRVTVSGTGRWAYLSLAPAVAAMRASTTPAQRRTRAAILVHAAG